MQNFLTNETFLISLQRIESLKLKLLNYTEAKPLKETFQRTSNSKASRRQDRKKTVFQQNQFLASIHLQLNKISDVQSNNIQNQHLKKVQRPVVLSIQDLFVSSPADFKSLAAISLRLQEGERIGIFGPKGSHKKYLVDTIMNLHGVSK